RLGEGPPTHGGATSGPSAIPPASALQLPTSSGRSAATSKGESSEKTNWDFEPVDAKPSVNPPTGSLFFAEETLERQREADAKKRGGPMRLVLWGIGGLIGVAFLVLSGWIALHGRVP